MTAEKTDAGTRGILASGHNATLFAILSDTLIIFLLIAGYNNTIGPLHTAFLLGAIILIVRTGLLTLGHLAIKVALALVMRAEEKGR